VNLHPSNARQRRQRQRSSITSQNSSLSSYSPPWVMTPRPQIQPWPNDCDFLTEEEPSVSGAETAASTWQEEAHWMSFRNAVYHFASAQTSKYEAPSSPLDGSRRTHASENSYALVEDSPSPPVGRIVRLQYGSVKNEHHNSFLAAEQSLSNPTSDVTVTDTEGEGNRPRKKDKDTQLKSMASDLAETKMRLALVQAERDELEFALLMGGVSESRSLSGAS
jgi:hypothetical protein